MNWEVFITLEGSPGMIQRIADAVESAFPGAFGWQDQAAGSPSPGSIVLKGVGFDLSGEHHSAFARATSAEVA